MFVYDLCDTAVKHGGGNTSRGRDILKFQIAKTHSMCIYISSHITFIESLGRTERWKRKFYLFRVVNGEGRLRS